jgi:hypothetical protein
LVPLPIGGWSDAVDVTFAYLPECLADAHAPAVEGLENPEVIAAQTFALASRPMAIVGARPELGISLLLVMHVHYHGQRRNRHVAARR